MVSFYRFGGLLAALLWCASATAGDIRVEGAWARAVPGRDSANVFFYISSERGAALTGASSPAAKAVELRTMEHKGGTMKTITVKSVSLPANARVDMTSIHGYHLTLIGLNGPLKDGAVVPLALDVETADKRGIKVDVRAEARPK